MNKTRITMHIVPKEIWKPREHSMGDIFPFAEDALAIERRIKKGVNLNNERMRYQLCCIRIQKAVLNMEKNENVSLGRDYYDLLHMLYDSFPAEVGDCRLLTCFFPPEKVKVHLYAFTKLITNAGFKEHEDIKTRIGFFEKAASIEAGVVETSEFLTEESEERGVVPPTIKGITGRHSRHVYREEDRLSEEKRAAMLEIFKTQIHEGIKNGGEINFSNQPHSIIAEALNEFVYKNSPDDSENSIRVIYMDGSEGKPFPIRCLTRPADLGDNKNVHALEASLISMRHLEMDEKVDFAWFRNSKVSVARPFAETEAYCTERTMEVLREIGDKELYLHLYQTGLETAVVGFYRGLVQVLRERRNNPVSNPLQVIPYYFNGKENMYKPGRPWA
ncbi:MAG: hypothetical protein U9R17_07280 [Thermodesulfobacteriota bacterium]|nr:hypothetical protein [Thermodesulfobacteriota bacterium]